jgi:outer membrane lipoprotein LolB
MRFLRAVRAAALGVLLPIVVVLPACSTLPAGSFDRKLQGRTIEGRMSVRYHDLATGKDDASSGRFVWTRDGDALELSLLDPLGQTVALIRSDARRSSIVFRDGRRVEGATPEALTEQTLGWTVPLRGLGDWLDGRTASDRPATLLDDGRVRQDGWTLRFQRDEGAAADAPPKRIDLVYPGPPAEIEMRLVVDQRSPS